MPVASGRESDARSKRVNHEQKSNRQPSPRPRGGPPRTGSGAHLRTLVIPFWPRSNGRRFCPSPAAISGDPARSVLSRQSPAAHRGGQGALSIVKHPPCCLCGDAACGDCRRWSRCGRAGGRHRASLLRDDLDVLVVDLDACRRTARRPGAGANERFLTARPWQLRAR
jgi:hypothetical protein